MKKVKCPICDHKDEIQCSVGSTVHRCKGCKNLVRIIECKEEKKEEVKEKQEVKESSKKKTSKKKKASKKKKDE